MKYCNLIPITMVIFPLDIFAAESRQSIETVVVIGHQANLIGKAISASEGTVGQEEISTRPIARTGEVLELIPGMVVTQHSGSGKANQYFLRGFNLDHGSDFATFVGGMPVNMRTHGHGQGYTDLNFVIPEAINSIEYKKGAYYADVGDFSGAGSANIKMSSQLKSGLLKLTGGQNNYFRAVGLDNSKSQHSDWLYAFELNGYDGPWTDINEDLQKVNVLLTHGSQVADGHLELSLMAYDNQWNSADQIPNRAVEAGLIDELGSLDTTAGGESSRYSINAQWTKDNVKANAYALNYDLNLWSNFTYALDDEENGDQFEQVDDRWIYGAQLSYTNDGQFAGKPTINTMGWDLRYDNIGEVGLYHTKNRQRLGAVRSDTVDELSSGIYWQNQLRWSDRIRSVLGLRYDFFRFDIDSLVDSNINGIDLTQNGGNATDSITSAKGSLIYSLTDEWESYLSAGQGFHSNDARGTTIAIDPADGSQVNPVDPLVRSFGYEAGLRGSIGQKLNTSIAVWSLRLDSELLFVGDAGNTEASRASQRHGAELTAYYQLSDVWTLDLEYALANAEFTDSAPEGNNIPGAINQVVQTGVNAKLANGWFADLRVRYFGARPLIEDNSIKSNPSTVVNLQAGYSRNCWTAKADILNLLDSNDHDIDYFYTSRLSTEPMGVGTDDIHYHVLEPRTLRVTVEYRL